MCHSRPKLTVATFRTTVAHTNFSISRSLATRLATCSLVWHVHMCDMPHSFVWHNSICLGVVTHLFVHLFVYFFIYLCVHLCDMTHAHSWSNPFTFTYVTWPIHICYSTNADSWNNPFTSSHICECEWLIPRMRIRGMWKWMRYSMNVTFTYVNVTWPTHMWLDPWHNSICLGVVTHLFVHLSFICATWPMFVCGISHSHMWLDPPTHAPHLRSARVEGGPRVIYT